MDRLQQVVHVLDAAIGGPDVNIGTHRAFWRGLTRDEFVSLKVFGLDVISVGDGAASNLVRALRGDAPFGADEPDPPPGAQFSRMPSGGPPVPAADIDLIEQWIDDGCPQGEAAEGPGTSPDPGTGPNPEPGPEPEPRPGDFTWRPTNAPDAGSRHDDVFFVTPDMGWAVNSDGKILRTDDGGASWVVQFSTPGLYLRCVGFASETHGWVGTVSPGQRLLTTSDGGATWVPASNLPADAPVMLCGLSVVDQDVVYASGTNYPFPAHRDRPPRMMRTLDGGATWTAWDMTRHASNLIDTFFTSPDRGWVVGGLADPTVDPGPGGHRSDNVRAVVLLTEDGGRTWTNKIADLAGQLPLGEWGWKIHFLDDRVGFVSLESLERGAILRTDDGGETWRRLEIDDPQMNKNLEGTASWTPTPGGSADGATPGSSAGSAARQPTAAARGPTPTRSGTSSTASGSWATRPGSGTPPACQSTSSPTSRFPPPSRRPYRHPLAGSSKTASRSRPIRRCSCRCRSPKGQPDWS